MSRSLTYEIPDQLYAAFEQMAAKSGASAETLALQWLGRQSQKRGRALSEEELRVAREQLMQFAGAVDSGDPRSADNEGIDADLAREYAHTHDE